jgi:hypothetical protein
MTPEQKVVNRRKSREWYHRNRDRARADKRAHYLKNRERFLTKQKEYYRNNPKKVNDGYRRIHLRKKYGLTVEQFRSLVAGQNGCCAICRKPLQLSQEGLNTYKAPVDHDHASKRVRGILCVTCNLGLGLIEREGWLEKAREYLRLHNTPVV